MPGDPIYSYDTPIGRVKIKCRKDNNFFYCNVDSVIYKNDIKLEKAKIAEAVKKFAAWLEEGEK